MSRYTQAALGNVSPELAWLQIRYKIVDAIEDYSQEIQEAEQQLRVDEEMDLQDLLALVGSWEPVFGINHLIWINDMDLTQIPKLPPLVVIRAVQRILTESERYEMLKWE